jgi:pilus assembly protein Flp/PilA
MKRLFEGVKGFWCEEEGATVVEYGVLVALIIAVCIVVIGVVGGKVNNAFEAVNGNMN